MGWKNEQCDKVCRILDNVLANRPTERDSLIVAVQKAFGALEGSEWVLCSERLPDTNRDVLLQFSTNMGVGFWEHNSWGINTGDNIYSEIGEGEVQPIAWMELPEPYRKE